MVTALALSAVAAQAATTFVPGYLTYEYYPGKNRTDVETGVAGAPSFDGTVIGSDQSGYVTKMEGGVNFAEGYANRIYGVFVPPADGDYVFFISGDDDSDLFLSTDNTPANKHLIAKEPSWSNPREWTSSSNGGADLASKRSDQFASTEWPDGATIHLLANQHYYIETVHAEGGGGDNIGVTFKLATDEDPANGTLATVGSAIGVEYPGALVNPTVTISQQPASGTFYVGGSVTVSIKATSDSPFPISYQWRKNGSPIPGANGATYIIGTPLTTDSGNYDVVMSLPDSTGAQKTTTSAVAAVTVLESPFVTGSLKYDYFPGSDRGAVEGGTAGAPSFAGATVGSDKSGYIGTAEAGRDFADNYANRISGMFIPPSTGNYVFLVYADDDTDVFLSTDDKPANKKLIAVEAGWSDYRNYNTIGGGSTIEGKRSDQFPGTQWTDGAGNPSNTITLQQGQHYYFEVVHHEGGGGDRVGVTYRLDTEDEALTANGTAPRLTGGVIGVSVPPQTISITTQPVNTTVYAGTPAHFIAAATTSGSFGIQYQWQRNGVDIPGATREFYSFVALAGNASANPPGDDGASFTVKMTVPGTVVTSNPAVLTVKTPSLVVNGALKREFYLNRDRGQLEAGRAYIANSVTALTSFDAPADVADNYVQRISGLFTPTVTGDYVFFTASDDDSDLFVSTDASPANKKLVAQQTTWGARREWTTAEGNNVQAPDTRVSQKRSDQWSPDGGATVPYASGIHLVAGTPYYIEGIQHEGGGGDNFAATFKLVADPDPVGVDDGNGGTIYPASAFTGALVSYITSPVTTASISTQPVAITSYEAQSATFTVGVTTDSELTPLYQWRKGGSPIAGATSSSYTIPFLNVADAGNYDVVVTVPNAAGGAMTSSTVALTVFPAPLVTGLLRYDYFPGKDRPTVEAGNGGTPDTSGYWEGANKSGYVPIGEAANDFADNYASRIYGFFIPPTTGNYVFFVNGDDDCDLFLSTDDQPAHKKLVAKEGAWSGWRNWVSVGDAAQRVEDKRSDQFTGTEWPTGNIITLTAGQLYYIEGVHHEGGGGDNFGITYKLDTDADPVNLQASTLKGSVIGVKVVPPSLGTTKPTVSSALATFDGVQLTMSAPIDHTTAVSGAFSLGAGVTVNSVDAKEVFVGSKIVTVLTLHTTGMQLNKTYNVVINGVKDTAGNVIAAATSVAVATPQLALDFNAGIPDSPAGIVVGGSASVVDDPTPITSQHGDTSPIMQLTDAVNSLQGALRIPDLAGGAPVAGFTATMKVYIGEGSGNAADGMSFNFGNIPDSVTSVGEEGTGVLSINFDTYNNGGLAGTGPISGRAEAPAFEVKLNGSIIGWVPFSKAAMVPDQWVDVVVSVNAADNSLSCVFNGQTFFDHLSLNSPINLTTGNPIGSFKPVTGGVFLLGARTGGEHARQAIDNMTILEVTAVVAPQFKSVVLNANGSITVTWDGGGTLQATPSLVAPVSWTDVTGATSPYTFTPQAGVPALYARIKQ